MTRARRGNGSTDAIVALLSMHASGLALMMSRTVDRLYWIE